MKKYRCLLSLVIAVVFYGHAANSHKYTLEDTTANPGVVKEYVEDGGLFKAQQRLAGMKISLSASEARQTKSQIIFGDSDQSDSDETSGLSASVDLSFAAQEEGPRNPYGIQTASAEAAKFEVDGINFKKTIAGLPAPDFETLGDPVKDFFKNYREQGLNSNQGSCEYLATDGSVLAVLIYTTAMTAAASQIQDIVVINDATKKSKEFRKWALNQLEALTNKKNPAENMDVDQGLSDRLEGEFGIRSTFNFKGPKWQLVRSKKQ